jgi:hypothetical protein
MTVRARSNRPSSLCVRGEGYAPVLSEHEELRFRQTVALAEAGADNTSTSQPLLRV